MYKWLLSLIGICTCDKNTALRTTADGKLYVECLDCLTKSEGIKTGGFTYNPQRGNPVGNAA